MAENEDKQLAERIRAARAYVQMNQTDFAKALGVSLVAVSRKLTGKSGFTGRDIEKWCEVLEIPLKEVGSYFFT